MKKITALLISLALVLGLCACARDSGRNTSSAWQKQYDLGVRFLSEGNYREAVIAFTAAIIIGPKQVDAYIGRGDAYAGLASTAEDSQAPYARAESDYLAALNLNALLEEVYIKLADLYVTAWDLEKAIGILEQAYEITKNDKIMERINALRVQPDLPDEFHDGAMIVTMYDAWSGFVGHDAYAFDDQGRMLSNIWYNQENEIQRGQSWEYDDEAGITRVTSFTSSYTEDPVIVEGCEDQGWYWEYMGAFSTDPSLEAVDGIVDLGNGKWVQYGYDSRGRVSSIYTYDQSDTLLGYCIVTYP